MSDNIIEFPDNQIERLFNRKPKNIEEWLKCQGLTEKQFIEMFGLDALNSVSISIDEVNKRMNNGK